MLNPYLHDSDTILEYLSQFSRASPCLNAACVAQLDADLTGDQEIAGPIPAGSSNIHS